MSFILACKAFIKAWKNPEKAKIFLEDSNLKTEDTKTNVVENTHLRLLGMLQQNGRFIDFIKEDISQFTDEQIGAVARQIHQDCAKCLEEYVTIRPLLQENEGDSIQIAKGYDANQIKLIGNIKGEPPYTGTLVHKGWKAHKRSLPKKIGEFDQDIIYSAEIEIR
ncbi:hypothetical protein BN1013_00797 [Candidatus Rubidus massiliensis]|nr:hypothetical protein BN1013_00797 [Candidatus Rubidus massiliensis]